MVVNMSEKMLPMHIAATGMISGLARGAQANAALMRLEYDAFQETSFHVPETGQPIIGAYIDDLDLRGTERLVSMAWNAIKEVLITPSVVNNTTPIDLVFCLADRGHDTLNHQVMTAFDRGMTQCIDQYGDEYGGELTNCYYYSTGRTSYVDALAFAHERLSSDQKPRHIMIVGVDSLVNNESISQLLGVSHSNFPGRLVIDDNPDGMFVGEAAAAILFTAHNTSTEIKNPSLYCTGMGYGEERATLHSDDVSRSQGLVQAVKQATAQAGIDVYNTDFRIAAVTGESYFFAEDSTMLYRCMNAPKADHALWHTADKIGEVGAATGAAMTVMAYWATQKNYAPGHNILCHISSETHKRGAFVLQYKST